MKKTRWFSPYAEPQKGLTRPRPTMADAWDSKRAGVYFIREQGSKKVVYVGMSISQLKKTIYRHFQRWDDRARRALWGKGERISYPKFGYEIRFIYTTPEQAMKLEKMYILKLEPKDNFEKYQGYFGFTDADETARARADADLNAYFNDAEEAPFLKKKEYLEEDYPF